MEKLETLIEKNDIKSIQALHLSSKDMNDFFIMSYPVNEALLAFIDKIDLLQLTPKNRDNFIFSFTNYQYFCKSENKLEEQQKLYPSLVSLLKKINWQEVDIINFFKPFHQEMSELMDLLRVVKETTLINQIGFAFLKHNLLNYQKLSHTHTIYLDNLEKQERKEFSQALYEAIEKIDTPEDLVIFLKQGQWDNIKKELSTKSCFNHIQAHQEAYLNSDLEATQIRILDNFAFGLNIENFHQKILKITNNLNIYSHNYTVDDSIFQQLPQHLGLKSVTFYKSIDSQAILKFILEGSENIKEVFQLQEQDSVGYKKLSLNFVFMQDRCSVALYKPEIKMIMINQDCLYDGIAFLLHEYTHFLQDLVLDLHQIEYKKHVPNKFKAFNEWKQIEAILRSEEKPEIHNLIHQFMSAYRPSKAQVEQMKDNPLVNVDLIHDKFNFVEQNMNDLFGNKINLRTLKQNFNHSSLVTTPRPEGLGFLVIR